MYKCFECGNIFEEGEENVTREMVGECMGETLFVEMSCCPACGGEYGMAKHCKTCLDYFVGDTDFCDDCYSYYKRDFRKLLDKTYSEDERKLLNIIFEGEEL